MFRGHRWRTEVIPPVHFHQRSWLGLWGWAQWSPGNQTEREFNNNWDGRELFSTGFILPPSGDNNYLQEGVHLLLDPINKPPLDNQAAKGKRQKQQKANFKTTSFFFLRNDQRIENVTMFLLYVFIFVLICDHHVWSAGLQVNLVRLKRQIAVKQRPTCC